MSRNDANRVRLKALIDLLALTVTDVAQVAGCSRPLMSRILNEGLDGSGVWAELEKNLPDLIARRRVSYFEVETVEVEKVVAVVEELKRVA